MAVPVLQEFIPPLGPQPANPALFSPQMTTLTLKEKVLSLTGDGFTVQKTDGAPLLQIKPKKISLHSTKVFLGMDNHELFTLSTKTLAMFKSFKAESDKGYNFEIKGRFSIGSSKSSVHFRNHADGRELELTVKGDWMDRSANILLGDRIVASISRQFLNAREIFGSKQTVSILESFFRGGNAFMWRWDADDCVVLRHRGAKR
jgi:uncharacterized protein YxjI